MLIVIAIGLAVAGIITDNGAFYWLAGIVGIFQVLMVLIAAAGVRAVHRSIKNFDAKSGLDMSSLRVSNRRPTYRR